MNKNIIAECNNKWSEFDVIYTAIMSLLNVKVGCLGDKCCVSSLFKGEKAMGYDEYDVYEFTNSLNCDEGVVTSIFLFGDGALEMLLEGAEEPICWDEFSLKSLTQIKEFLYDEMQLNIS